MSDGDKEDEGGKAGPPAGNVTHQIGRDRPADGHADDRNEEEARLDRKLNGFTGDLDTGDGGKAHRNDRTEQPWQGRADPARDEGTAGANEDRRDESDGVVILAKQVNGARMVQTMALA